jgi:hypothetical protein
MHMTTRRPRPTAPDGLLIPDWVADVLNQPGSSRAELVLRHGFSEQGIGPGWWQTRLETAGLASEGAPAITFRSRRDDGTPVLTRADLFDSARSTARCGHEEYRRAVAALSVARPRLGFRTCRVDLAASGSYNWYTDTYLSYCQLSAHWADATSIETGREIAAEEIERVPFDGTQGA